MSGPRAPRGSLKPPAALPDLPPPDPGELVAPDPAYRVAAEPLFVGAALAHVPGDRVPLDSVVRNGWQAQVLMPPPDPPHHSAESDVDSESSDGEPGRSAHV